MNSGEGLGNGVAWVKDGKVCVRNPEPGGRPAVIVPPRDAEVLVSGRKIANEEPVTESSVIQVHLPDKPPRVNYLVQITKGGLEAHARLDIHAGEKRVLKDAPPAERLVLQCETRPEVPVPDPKQLVEVMREMGVEFGIDRAACIAGCEKPSADPFVVARGKPYEPGQDGEIQLLVPLERVVDLPADVLQVDFRDTVKLPDVKQGQTIALKKLPIPGTPGTAVTGLSIPAPRPKDPRFRAGKGVELRDEGGTILAVASTAGCPVFAEESGTVSVDPVLTHKGNVDMASGNVRSSGSVAIMGHVTEGMRVEAEGNLDIAGSVTEATVRAWGSVRILGNVFKSAVVAGKDSSWTRKMDGLLRGVEDSAASLLALEASFWDAMSRKSAGEPAVGDDELLDEGRQIDGFRNFAVALSGLLKENILAFPSEIAEEVRQTREALSAYGLGIFDRTRSIAELLKNARTHIDSELLKGKSDVTMPYAQSCTIEASRDIIITGQGAFYSNLLAGRAIKVTGSPGLVRSGEARARELIQVNTAGGQGAAPTILAVAADGKIQADIIHPNTVITVGRLSFRNEDTLHSVKASMIDGSLRVITAYGSWDIQ